MPFTPEELAEMAAADAEIEENFRLTNEDLAFSRELDREAELAAMTSEKRKRAEYQKAYYEANREENQWIGSEIKAVRKAFGYTQQYIAELLGVTKSAVSLWEKGAVPAPLDKLQAFLPGLAEKIRGVKKGWKVISRSRWRT